MKLTVTVELEYLSAHRPFERDELLTEIALACKGALVDVAAATTVGSRVLSHAFTEKPSRRVAD